MVVNLVGKVSPIFTIHTVYLVPYENSSTTTVFHHTQIALKIILFSSLYPGCTCVHAIRDWLCTFDLWYLTPSHSRRSYQSEEHVIKSQAKVSFCVECPKSLVWRELGKMKWNYCHCLISISSSFSLSAFSVVIWQRDCPSMRHVHGFSMDVWALHKLTIIIII